MERQSVQTAAQWEPIIGYSRAVKTGPFIAITGTTSLDERGELVGEGDAAAQTRRCLQIIRQTLERLGARLEDVVRTRMFVTDIARWEEVGRAHGEVFGSVRPACTGVVAQLLDPRWLVEIEADALLP
jgi:enamine deaminase RidA (YjgF/YER057c/UK114 family)